MNQKKAKKLRRDAKLITTKDPQGLPTEDITKQYYLNGKITKEVTGRKVVIPASGTVEHHQDSNRAVYQHLKKLAVANAK